MYLNMASMKEIKRTINVYYTSTWFRPLNINGSVQNIHNHSEQYTQQLMRVKYPSHLIKNTSIYDANIFLRKYHGHHKLRISTFPFENWTILRDVGKKWESWGPIGRFFPACNLSVLLWCWWMAVVFWLISASAALNEDKILPKRRGSHS